MISSYLYVMCEFFKFHKGFLSRKKLFHYQIPCYYYCFQIDYPNPPGYSIFIWLENALGKTNLQLSCMYNSRVKILLEGNFLTL